MANGNTTGTPEERAREVFAGIKAELDSMDKGDDLALKRAKRLVEESAREPHEVRVIVQGLIMQEANAAKAAAEARAADIVEGEKAHEELSRIWQERYPDAQSLGEVVTRAQAEGLDLVGLADKAFPEDLMIEMYGDPLAPLDGLEQDSPVVSMTVQCNTEGVGHNVEIHAVHRDGTRMFAWTINHLEGDEEGWVDLNGGYGPVGSPGQPLATPRQAFDAAMDALAKHGGPAGLIEECGSPIDLSDLTHALNSAVTHSGARRRRSARRVLRQAS